jgi:hypothetical protein
MSEEMTGDDRAMNLQAIEIEGRNLLQELFTLHTTVTKMKIARNTYNDLNLRLSEDLRIANATLAEKEAEIERLMKIIDDKEHFSGKYWLMANKAEAELAELRERMKGIEEFYEQNNSNPDWVNNSYYSGAWSVICAIVEKK